MLDTLRSGRWFRGNGPNVDRFEAAYAKLTGAKFCVATSSGTNALIAAMNALGVGAGDEVILPPYTFVACANAVLMLGALPVFVDVDPATFQIDPAKIEAAVTDRTAAVMPVHIGGSAADLDAILAVARVHKLPVVEDACQAHARRVARAASSGTLGDAGCFSFQASKNLTAGEGGAIVTDDEALADRCFAAQTNGRSRKPKAGNVLRGANLRMSAFHAALLLAQMERLPAQAALRDASAARLDRLLADIPGITPARAYGGCTRRAHHLYMFRYDPAMFANLPRATFLRALRAEGIPASGGYAPLNREPFIAATLRTRGYRRSFPENVLSEWSDRTKCPRSDALCDQAVWLTQDVLLAGGDAMESTAAAIRKIHAHAADLAKA